jgi:hypothetical protein
MPPIDAQCVSVGRNAREARPRGSESTLKIAKPVGEPRGTYGSQNHDLSIKNSTFRPVSVLFRRSTCSREAFTCMMQL